MDLMLLIIEEISKQMKDLGNDISNLQFVMNSLNDYKLVCKFALTELQSGPQSLLCPFFHIDLDSACSSL